MRSGESFTRRAKPIHHTARGIAIAASLACAALTAHATVTTVAWYQLGETDPGAAANALGQNPTLDSSINSFNLTRSGAPTNRADTAALSFGSSLSMQWHDPGNAASGDGYFTNTPVTTAVNNFGFEMWVKPLATPGVFAYLFYNGSSNGEGIALDPSGKWQAGRTGAGFDFTTASATLGQWEHLALVWDGGVEKFYTNGVLFGSAALAPIAAGTQFSIGGYQNGQYGFNGLIDQFRVFTFAPGQFSPSDLLIGTPIPEPGAIGLFALGGVAVLRRYRRK